ncbi:hypothetical protein EDD21DRAFT_378385 [Dissophora ornata]|nr:hypothetical protein BGZ58_007289 [Dissophora ornata]KAI8599983.1 hypothetical protein EDD21DRAFT_378385 [Dissophora ornata]
MESETSLLTTRDLSQLPNEILENIFVTLPWRGRFACLTVCRGWHAAAITSLYASLPISALSTDPRSLASCQKYVHLTKELHWTYINPRDPRYNSAKEFFLLPEHYDRHRVVPVTIPEEASLALTTASEPSSLPQDGEQVHTASTRPRPSLNSLIYVEFAKRSDNESLLESIIASQPTLAQANISGASISRLSIEDILESLPRLKDLKVTNCFCNAMTPSRWQVQAEDPDDNQSFGSSSSPSTMTTVDPVPGNINNQNSTGGVAAGPESRSPLVKAKPPFGLQRLSFPNAFNGIDKYDLFFSALPELVSIDINTKALMNNLYIFSFMDPFPSENPWDEPKSIFFAESLLRNCPKLRILNIAGENCSVRLDPVDYIPGAKHNRDGKTPLDKVLPRILKELDESTYRTSRESLNWLLDVCGDGVVTMNISTILTRDPGIPATDAVGLISQGGNITNKDMQRILESCPNLKTLVARGRYIDVKDMAPLSAFTKNGLPSSSSPPVMSKHNDVEEKVAAEGQGNNSRPWACTRMLDRLVVGITAETDDPSEHRKVWTQLGELTRLTALELYETNLIPKLSHGFGEMKDLKRIYAFTIEHWSMPGKAGISMGASGEESQQEGESQGETEMAARMMDSDTVEWMAVHWARLGALRLDYSGKNEQQEEMRALVEKEKAAGRMKIVQLTMARLP